MGDAACGVVVSAANCVVRFKPNDVERPAFFVCSPVGLANDAPSPRLCGIFTFSLLTPHFSLTPHVRNFR